MKIYCSKDLLDLSKFAGKRVWVKCGLIKYPDMQYYLKVLKYNPDTNELSYCKISADFIDDNRPLFRYELCGCLDLINDPTYEDIHREHNRSCWKIVTPEEVFTDNEMIGTLLHRGTVD